AVTSSCASATRVAPPITARRARSERTDARARARVGARAGRVVPRVVPRNRRERRGERLGAEPLGRTRRGGARGTARRGGPGWSGGAARARHARVSTASRRRSRSPSARPGSGSADPKTAVATLRPHLQNGPPRPRVPPEERARVFLKTLTLRGFKSFADKTVL